MTDNQQENEKLLSFKERILRDLEEANKQIVQVEKEYDLPVQEISIAENKEEETEGSLPELVSEESEVQDKVEIPEEAEVPEVTEIPDLKGREDETQEETPLSSVSRKDRDQRAQKKKKQNTIAK